MNWLKRLFTGSRTSTKKRRSPSHYNCARVYVGGYLGGGTNEWEKWMECKYEVVDGVILPKRLRSVRVRGTNTEGTMYTLQTFVLYPETETATVEITNGRRRFTIQLLKHRTGRSTIFKLRL